MDDIAGIRNPNMGVKIRTAIDTISPYYISLTQFLNTLSKTLDKRPIMLYIPYVTNVHACYNNVESD